MRYLLTCAALVAALFGVFLGTAGSARAEEPTPEERAFFEVRVEPTTVVVGQPVGVTLRILYDEAFFAQHAASLFRQALDLEVQVTAPWLETLEGAVLMPPLLLLGMGDQEPRIDARLALGDAVTSLRLTGPELQGQRRFMVLTAKRTLIAKRAGSLVLSAPTLRYAYAVSIEESLLGERIAADTRPVVIHGKETTIDVREPPPEGRPSGFAGAVGRFTVEARVEDPAVTVGESFPLVFLISGEGNLGLIAQPRLPELDGFHVYGAREEPSDDPAPGRRVITYDIALTRAGIEEIPPLPFVFYDPAMGYQTVHSAPVRLQVRVDESAVPTPAVDTPAVPDGDPQTGDERTPAGLMVFAILAAVAMVGFAGMVLFTKRPRRTAPAPIPAATPDRSEDRAATKEALLAVLAEARGSTMAPYVAFLAMHLDCGEGAVVGPTLATRLHDAGVPPDLAQRAAGAMDALVIRRYGGEADSTLDAALVAEIHVALSGARFS